MLHTKSQGHRPSGSGEVDFWRVFTIYRHGGHLGHVTKTISSSDFIWDFGKLPFPTHLGKYFIKIGKIRAKIHEIGKIKAIFWLGMTPIYGLKNGQTKSLIWTNFCSPITRSLHIKYEFNWPSSFRGEDVWKCWWATDGWTDKGRRSHWYTFSSPMSLRLRWANNTEFQKFKSSKS